MPTVAGPLSAASTRDGGFPRYGSAIPRVLERLSGRRKCATTGHRRRRTNCGWNCYRSFPWLESVVERYGARGLVTIGIHSPEFDRERDRKTVVAKAKTFGLRHPTMIDNDLSYWHALDNRFWPTWYIVDQEGIIRTVVVGEVHRGDRRAMTMEAAIDSLLSAQQAPGNPQSRPPARSRARGL